MSTPGAKAAYLQRQADAGIRTGETAWPEPPTHRARVASNARPDWHPDWEKANVALARVLNLASGLEWDGRQHLSGKEWNRRNARAGGLARAAALTPAQRSEMARRAAIARWHRASARSSAATRVVGTTPKRDSQST